MPQSSLTILRETIATLENRPQTISETDNLSVIRETDSTLSSIDRLENGTLTEVVPSGYRDRIAALGKVMASLASLTETTDEPIIWCQLRDQDRLHLHAPGLTAFGIDPKRITKVTLFTERDLLWVMEEAITSGSVAAVAGVLWSERFYDFTASKRLRMRARETDTAVVMVRSHRANGTTAADHRLSVTTEPSVGGAHRSGAFGLLGNPAWHIDLTKCRHSSLGSHHVSWNPEALRLHMATALADRTAQAHAPPISEPVAKLHAVS